jgi:hypothetical protein
MTSDSITISVVSSPASCRSEVTFPELITAYRLRRAYLVVLRRCVDATASAPACPALAAAKAAMLPVPGRAIPFSPASASGLARTLSLSEIARLQALKDHF